MDLVGSGSAPLVRAPVNNVSAFYNYFYEQNQMIANASSQGIQLNFNTLGVINGIIDEYIQVNSEYSQLDSVNSGKI